MCTNVYICASVLFSAFIIYLNGALDTVQEKMTRRVKLSCTRGVKIAMNRINYEYYKIGRDYEN